MIVIVVAHTRGRDFLAQSNWHHRLHLQLDKPHTTVLQVTIACDESSDIEVT